MGNGDRAIACFSRALELGMKPYEVYYERSKAYAEKGEFAKAIADANDAIAGLNISSSYENRADIFAKQPDLDNAVKDYTWAIHDTKKRMKKDSSELYQGKAEDLYRLYLKRAVAYFTKRSWERSIADYMAAVKMITPGPAQAPIYLLIAEVYQARGDARTASKYRQKAWALVPKIKS